MKGNETGGYGFIGCRAAGKPDAVMLISAFSSAGYRAQPLNAAVVFGKDHLLSACLHAERALKRGTAASQDLMTVIAMYAGCSRQLSKALAIVRVTSQREIAVVTSPAASRKDADAILARLGMQRDDSLLETSGWKASNAHLLGIETTDLASISEAVLEKVALVDLER